MKLVLHDLETGRETTVAERVDRLTVSPDGTQIAAVGGLDFTKFPPTGRETLDLLDVDTGEVRQLDGPLGEGSTRVRSGRTTAGASPTSWARRRIRT